MTTGMVACPNLIVEGRCRGMLHKRRNARIENAFKRTANGKAIQPTLLNQPNE